MTTEYKHQKRSSHYPILRRQKLHLLQFSNLPKGRNVCSSRRTEPNLHKDQQWQKLISNCSNSNPPFLSLLCLMVLLAPSHKLSSKLADNHHGHQQEAFSAILQAFKSKIATYLTLFYLNTNSKPGSEILTLSWVRQCLQLLPSMKIAFGKLMVDIDYPMSKWQASSVDEYMKHSLKLLEILNSITSSLSHLGQARMSLSYGLSLLENSPSLAIELLEAIEPLGSNKKQEGEETEAGGEVAVCSSGKEWVVCQAMAIMKVVGFWVGGVVASSLCGDIESCLKLRKLIGEFPNSSLMSLHSSICEEMEKGGLFEVREVNKGVAQLVGVTCGGPSSDVVEELRRKVEILGKLMEDVGEEVNRVFSEVMLERNDLLSSLHQEQ